MKISDLPPGLKELAEKRNIDSGSLFANNLDLAFCWNTTPERHDFWSQINKGNFQVYHGCKVTNLKRK